MSTATDNTVATAVTGATVWAKLTASNLTGTGNSFGAQLLHVRDEKAAGTDGGTFTSGAWRTRTLNTTKTNEIVGASLAANQITLPAGTYFAQARAQGYKCEDHKIRLYNTTDAATLVVGSNGNGSNTNYIGQDSTLNGRFTLAGIKVLELQHRCSSTQTTDGFGTGMSFISEVEVYGEVMIWKLA